MMSQKVDFRALQNKVLGYALKKNLLPKLDDLDPSIKWDFMLTLGIRSLIPRRKPIHVDETIISNTTLFFNWYLFEREYEKGKTIGEIYIESEDFEKDFGAGDLTLKEDLKNMRSPLCNVFVVVGKKERDEYLVRPLQGGEELLIHDKSSFPQVHIGDAFYSILYRFDGRYYLGSEKSTIIPKKAVEEYYKTRSLTKLLEEEFDKFMETKSALSERTLREKEEMLPYLLHYIEEKGYTKLDQIKKMNPDTWMRWARRRYLDFPRSKEDTYKRTLRQFLKHIYGEKTSK